MTLRHGALLLTVGIIGAGGAGAQDMVSCGSGASGMRAQELLSPTAAGTRAINALKTGDAAVLAEAVGAHRVYLSRCGPE